MHTKLKINQYLKSLDQILNQIQSYIDNNSIRDPDIVDSFFDLQMKFESISETITYQYNNNDYNHSVKIVKDCGYASISRISRSLNLRYNQCFKIILKMEQQGLITKPDDKGIRKLLI